MNNTVSQHELAQLESLLPESAHQLIGVIGYAATAKLITHLGGVTLSARQGKAVARNNAAFEKLTSLLTDEEYKKLLACMGGTPFYIPRCDRALIKLRNARFIAELKEMTLQGNSCRSALTVLCPKYGFADRFAWRLLSEHNAASETQQDSLFD
ncbi:hypothetical protein [Morganella morganii]|uniref:hypothetical protein n=1 Tax=Morganella morganii TaxID=582 RepID=UPI0003DCB762|nr:hypothetical protein [Morganella morganii]HAS8350215.1 mor transcription activator family protein [Vibrio vulnificus]EKU4286121.1 mor transcription activator family protein [Morganella morganii]EKU4304193.1 mor transcription activator family protein [Morganella morganii]ELA7729454.1 mor transcription activator family protein [Morganella morganii]ELA7729934.1 mor transcription activator family protein [Morganella morganii]